VVVSESLSLPSFILASDCVSLAVVMSRVFFIAKDDFLGVNQVPEGDRSGWILVPCLQLWLHLKFYFSSAREGNYYI